MIKSLSSTLSDNTTEAHIIFAAVWKGFTLWRERWAHACIIHTGCYCCYKSSTVHQPLLYISSTTVEWISEYFVCFFLIIQDPTCDQPPENYLLKMMVSLQPSSQSTVVNEATWQWQTAAVNMLVTFRGYVRQSWRPISQSLIPFSVCFAFVWFILFCENIFFWLWKWAFSFFKADGGPHLGFSLFKID